MMECSEESISTLKFADRAKQVMVRVKANEVKASDDALVQKLQKEVQHLREVLNIRKSKNEMSGQLYQLKQENAKLKTNMSQVERLMFENKIMKLEIQRMKPGSGGSQNSGSRFNSEMSTDPTQKFNRSGKSPADGSPQSIGREVPPTCPLCNSVPPCAHY